MMFVHDAIRAHLLEHAGMVEQRLPDPVDLAELQQTERDPRFETLRRNRLIMGAYRYQRMHAQSGYDTIRTAIKRLEAYLQDPNQEHLVDVANYCEIEFVRKEVMPRAYFKPLDGDDAEAHHASKLDR